MSGLPSDLEPVGVLLDRQEGKVSSPQSSRLSLAILPELLIATASECPSLVTVQLAFLGPDSLSFQCLALSGTDKHS